MVFKPRVRKSNVVLEVKEEGELMKFLLANLPGKNRNNIKTLLKDRHIVVDGKVTSQFNHPLTKGMKVEVRYEKISLAKQYNGINIIFEDEHIVVIDKHPGILSVATDTEKKETAYHLLSNHVKTNHVDNKIFVVHRLDRETSGLMIYAKSIQAKKILQESWNDIVTQRSYLAVVEGAVQKDKDTITSYLKETSALMVYSSKNPAHGTLAITHYEVLKRSRKYSLLKVDLETGRKNQVRVHMKDIGHSVVGDKKYGAKDNPIARLALHAWILAFKHPITGEEKIFKTPMPKKFTRLF